MPVFGLRSRFAFVIGPADAERGLRQVDIYAAGRWVTCDDSGAYAPQFAQSLMACVATLLSDRPSEKVRRPYPDLSPEDNHRRLRGDADAGGNAGYLAEQYRFMSWGPTTDNVIAHLFIEDGTAFIPFSFWRPEHHDPSALGRVFLAELPERELLRLLHRAAWELACGGAR